jgi:hypothetical protein
MYNISYKSKYEKYKLKYLELLKIIGGVPPKSQDLKINIDCFNKKFKQKYDDKLSILPIISKFEPNYEQWDTFIENTFNYIKENLELDEKLILKFLNNYFEIIYKRTNDKHSTKETLINIIKEIVNETVEFKEKYGDDEFITILNTFANFGKNSIQEKYLEVQKSKIPTVEADNIVLYCDIYEKVRKLISLPKSLKEEKSILNFTIPVEQFTDVQRNTLKNTVVNLHQKMPSELQSSLFLLSDRDIYKLLEEVILRGFSINIESLQDENGRGVNVIHFLRPKNELSKKVTGDEKKKEKLRMSIYVEIIEVGIVKEFFSRIKELILFNFEVLSILDNEKNKKRGLSYLTQVQLKEDQIKKKTGHLQIILDLYKHIHNENLWNFVIILYNINSQKNQELYNDIGLIISFIMINYPLDQVNKLERIQLCLQKLINYINYKSK